VVRPPQGWDGLHADVIRPACARCHAELATGDPAAAWQGAADLGWIAPEELAASKLFQAMLGRGGLRPMPPPPDALDADALQRLSAFLAGLPTQAKR
jgi:hypothetical protein